MVYTTLLLLSFTAQKPPSISPLLGTLDEPVMIDVKGGTFKMGLTAEQGSDYFKDEKPAHKVTVNSFSISKYEVTVGQYLQFCKETNTHWPEWLEKGNPFNVETGVDLGYESRAYYDQGYRRKGCDLLPIIGVSWNDAVAYCKWLNKKTGKLYRLPTEAEWEFAARGGNQTKGYKYSGSNRLKEVGWYDTTPKSREKNVDKPRAIGTKQPNELGIHDMSGNVYEWCSDFYGPYTSAAAINPKGPKHGKGRVFRGGCWDDDDWFCRISMRAYDVATHRNISLGFRVAADILLP